MAVIQKCVVLHRQWAIWAWAHYNVAQGPITPVTTHRAKPTQSNGYFSEGNTRKDPKTNPRPSWRGKAEWSETNPATRRSQSIHQPGTEPSRFSASRIGRGAGHLQSTP